jgi:UDP-N-acetylmuramate dehydrogenase
MTFQKNISLRPYHSFGMDVTARLFAGFSNIGELELLLREKPEGLPLLVLGGGSNLLFKKDYDGLVLKNGIMGMEVVEDRGREVVVRAGAGESWHGFVMYCVENGLGGVENLSLIPGNVGASPMQNIGAYGVEIKDVFQELEAFDMKEGVVRKFSLEECAFGYRESVFKNIYRGRFVILSVSYLLKRDPEFNVSYGAIRQELEKMGVEELSIRAVSEAVISIRRSKLPDPAEIGNAGSFFKNPVVPNGQFEKLKSEYPSIVAFPAGEERTKLAAGWLIEQCGWKGFRKGDAGCYPKQALVLVNYGNASGQEVYQLSEDIIVSVKEKFGVELEREVNVEG